jgi:hypothetical protein
MPKYLVTMNLLRTDPLLPVAQSEEELYEMLEGLPLWDEVEVEATRMQGFEELVDSEETAEP